MPKLIMNDENKDRELTTQEVEKFITKRPVGRPTTHESVEARAEYHKELRKKRAAMIRLEQMFDSLNNDDWPVVIREFNIVVDRIRNKVAERNSK